MMDISREIVVKAPARRVWAVLTGFASYPDWTTNVRIRGELAIGGPLDYGIRFGRASPQPRYFNMAGNVASLDPPNSLVWETGFKALLILRFAIDVAPRPGGAKVRQSLHVGGPLAAVAGGKLCRVFGRVFEHVSSDLQARLGGTARPAGRRARPGARP